MKILNLKMPCSVRFLYVHLLFLIAF
jgi:hypothetical protein